MYNRSKGGIHVFGRTKLGYLGKSAVDLVAHRGDNVVDWYLILFVDESLGPDLCIDLVASLQVLADVVFLLCDGRQLLAPVDVHPCLRLAKQ